MSYIDKLEALFDKIDVNWVLRDSRCDDECHLHVYQIESTNIGASRIDVSTRVMTEHGLDLEDCAKKLLERLSLWV
jgi:hypothetical protein